MTRWKGGAVPKDMGAPRFLNQDSARLPSGGANLISRAAAELRPHARDGFRRDVADLLRGTLQPTLEDVEQSVAYALDLARRRGAVA